VPSGFDPFMFSFWGLWPLAEKAISWDFHTPASRLQENQLKAVVGGSYLLSLAVASFINFP